MKRPLSLALMAAALLLGPTSSAAVPAVSAGIYHRPIVTRSVGNNTMTSTNWSGYAVEAASQFTEAVGSWIQPASACASGGRTYGSFWVGVDGYATNSVEQLGTDSDCLSRGHPSYYAWWEMYPAASVQLSTSKYPVAAGDTLRASVSRTGASYTLSLVSSRGWTFSTTQTASDANASAEWVAESPEICSWWSCTLANLTNFGTMGFSSAQAATGSVAQPISTFTADGGPHEITMTTTSGTTRAQPGALTSGGTGFSDTWHHA
jgi:hypothetical protein